MRDVSTVYIEGSKKAEGSLSHFQGIKIHSGVDISQTGTEGVIWGSYWDHE